MAINKEIHHEGTTREPVLSPVDRVSEMLFGLFMALTFVGAISVAESGDAQIREMFIAALGCNLAWGLVDAVMYLVRTVTDRGRQLSLIRSVRHRNRQDRLRVRAHHDWLRLSAHWLRQVAEPGFRSVGGRYVQLSELAARSDIVSLHCPLTRETHYLVDANALAIVTGHQAFFTREAIGTICATTISSISAYAEGRPLAREVRAVV